MDDCPYCGTRLILDNETLAWVCPMCGTVYDYEILPPFISSSDLGTYCYGVLNKEVVDYAEELFREEVLPELSRLDKRKSERVSGILESLVKKREYSVSWSTIREAAEIARSRNLNVRPSEIRSGQVLNYIRSLVESCDLGVSAEEIYAFAARYRDLWSGRRPETIASVFTYLYAKLRLRREVSIPMKTGAKKLAKLFERILVERGESS